MAYQNPDPFQAIADGSRRDILMLLSKERRSINALAENFRISRPAVSKHVKVLHEAGLVKIVSEGRERVCELNRNGFDQLRDWLSYYDQFWKEKMNNLENLLHQRSNNKLS